MTDDLATLLIGLVKAAVTIDPSSANSQNLVNDLRDFLHHDTGIGREVCDTLVAEVRAIVDLASSDEIDAHCAPIEDLPPGLYLATREDGSWAIWNAISNAPHHRWRLRGFDADADAVSTVMGGDARGWRCSHLPDRWRIVRLLRRYSDDEAARVLEAHERRQRAEIRDEGAE